MYFQNTYIVIYLYMIYTACHVNIPCLRWIWKYIPRTVALIKRDEPQVAISTRTLYCHCSITKNFRYLTWSTWNVWWYHSSIFFPLDALNPRLKTIRKHPTVQVAYGHPHLKTTFPIIPCLATCLTTICGQSTFRLRFITSWWFQPIWKT